VVVEQDQQQVEMMVQQTLEVAVDLAVDQEHVMIQVVVVQV
jgi:hypothetical protein|tara:strand:- start:211 stop:333 length:123 start_codon:yes stop_codon:yes gene_type:complete